MPTPPLPAWFGKLPALGDFASRRMAPELLSWWDAWLAQGLLDLQARHRRRGSPWLDDYLVSPSWQFLLTPGCLPLGAAGLDAPAWLGCLMPSVDRVGRYFPFLILQALPRLPARWAEWQAVQQRLQALDVCAADALDQDWGVERLEAELAAWPELCWEPARLHETIEPWRELAGDPVLDEGLQLWAQRGAPEHSSARSYWRASAAPIGDESGQAASPRWRVAAGMPRSAADFLGSAAD